MRQTTGTRKNPSARIVKNIKRGTRKQYSSEQKIRIVLDGLRGKDSIAELCRRLKDFRRIATRYDKSADIFLSAVFIAAIAAWWI